MICPAFRDDHLERPQSLIIWNDTSVGRISLYFSKIVQRPRDILFPNKAFKKSGSLHKISSTYLLFSMLTSAAHFAV